MESLERLVAIEAIRNVKARYWYAMDVGDPAVIVGAGAIADFIRTVVADWTTVHHGHAPIIEVEDPDHGTAIWPIRADGAYPSAERLVQV
jgi:hypothetical protein